MKSSFLGTGWSFPIAVDPATGRIQMVQDEEDVRQSIGIILRTAKGERVMRPDFGCGIQAFVFENTDPATLRRMESTVTDAIVTWEPRVTQVKATASVNPAQPSLVSIQVQYAIRTTNTVYNLVYPFYLSEGLK